MKNGDASRIVEYDLKEPGCTFQQLKSLQCPALLDLLKRDKIDYQARLNGDDDDRFSMGLKWVVLDDAAPIYRVSGSLHQSLADLPRFSPTKSKQTEAAPQSPAAKAAPQSGSTR